jgi:hypothetical protein
VRLLFLQILHSVLTKMAFRVKEFQRELRGAAHVVVEREPERDAARRDPRVNSRASNLWH